MPLGWLLFPGFSWYLGTYFLGDFFAMGESHIPQAIFDPSQMVAFHIMIVLDNNYIYIYISQDTK